MAQALFCLQIIVPCIETKPFTVKKGFFACRLQKFVRICRCARFLRQFHSTLATDFELLQSFVRKTPFSGKLHCCQLQDVLVFCTT